MAWGSKLKSILAGVKDVAEVGGMLGLPFADKIVQAIHITEVIPGLKGPQKKEAAKALAVALVGDEGLLSQDQELAAIVDRFIDDYVALMNRVAVLRNAA